MQEIKKELEDKYTMQKKQGSPIFIEGLLIDPIEVEGIISKYRTSPCLYK